jgi:hypothetical protein
VIVSSVTETAEEVGKLLRKENSLREISQKDKSQRDQTREAPGSEADLKERYLNEIDPRRSFWGILRSKYHQIRCLSLLTGDFSL